MQPYYDIDADTPFSMALTVIGMGWNKSIFAFDALKGMTTVMLMNTMEHVRYLTNITGPTWHRLAPSWHRLAGALVWMHQMP
jgi:hypothetical protein